MGTQPDSQPNFEAIISHYASGYEADRLNIETSQLEGSGGIDNRASRTKNPQETVLFTRVILWGVLNLHVVEGRYLLTGGPICVFGKQPRSLVASFSV